MYIAIGGSYDVTNYWTGKISTKIRDTMKEATLNIAFGTKCLVLQSELDNTYAGKCGIAADKWTQDVADEIVKEVQQEYDYDLLLAETPDCENEFLDTILDPFGDMIIISEQEESALVEKWKEIQEEFDLTFSHHIITGVSSEDVLYETTSEGVVIVKVESPGPVMKETKYRRRTEDVLDKLARDLVGRSRN